MPGRGLLASSCGQQTACLRISLPILSRHHDALDDESHRRHCYTLRLADVPAKDRVREGIWGREAQRLTIRASRMRMEEWTSTLSHSHRMLAPFACAESQVMPGSGDLGDDWWMRRGPTTYVRNEADVDRLSYPGDDICEGTRVLGDDTATLPGCNPPSQPPDTLRTRSRSWRAPAKDVGYGKGDQVQLSSSPSPTCLPAP